MIGAVVEQSAEVTNWPARIALVLAVLAVMALAFWGMRRGWLNRAERQADTEEPASAPPPGALLSAPVRGLFVGTSTYGDFMDRIVVFDLGVPSDAEVSWGDAGVWLDRVGARGLFIPSASIVGVRTDAGVANLVRSKDSVVVITWRLGDRVLDTGFRPAEAADHEVVLDGLMSTSPSGAPE